jgi:hypothetical protein
VYIKKLSEHLALPHEEIKYKFSEVNKIAEVLIQLAEQKGDKFINIFLFNAILEYWGEKLVKFISFHPKGQENQRCHYLFTANTPFQQTLAGAEQIPKVQRSMDPAQAPERCNIRALGITRAVSIP